MIKTKHEDKQYQQFQLRTIIPLI